MRARTGGCVVLSGILDTQAEAVADAYWRWFNIGIWGREDGWVALVGSRVEHGN
jgi:ribosomal protein L11 methylase PrmA